jgi:hypothetical protein
MTGNEATGGARSFRFGVVAPLRTELPAWRDQVRRIADSGYSTLLMPDVQQWQPAPGPTLAVAATLRPAGGYVGIRLSAGWSQPVEATELTLSPELSSRRSSANTSAGVLNPSIARGRSLISSATAFR